MKIDKHFDPVGDLEQELINELEAITKQLGGKMTRSKRNYRGRLSKFIEIEYDIVG
tara:strand:- start:563 stop:730 length:168 start_codon:yes stop_codon:yes gene_type:complete